MQGSNMDALKNFTMLAHSTLHSLLLQSVNFLTLCAVL